MVRAAALLLLHLLTAPVVPEKVDVRNRGPVDLGEFECRDINRSSILQRVCYARERRTLIVAIRGAYDQYCELPAETYDALMGAPSMGRFFNRNIRVTASGSRYDCRTGRPAR